MSRGFLSHLACALTIAVVTSSISAAQHPREPKEPPLDIRERLIRLIKKLPKPPLATIFDDYPTPPKP